MNEKRFSDSEHFKKPYSDSRIKELFEGSFSRLKEANKKGDEKRIGRELSEAKLFLTTIDHVLNRPDYDRLYSEYWDKVSVLLNRNVDQDSIRACFNPGGKVRNSLFQILPDIFVTIRDHDTGVEYTLNRKGKIISSTKSDISVNISNLVLVIAHYREELKILGYKGPDPISEPDEYARMWGVRKGIIQEG